MKKKILILGASGFIGKNLALELSKNKNFQITGTYFKKKTFLKKVKMIRVDLTKKKSTLNLEKMIRTVILLIAPINDNEVINLIEELDALNIMKTGDSLTKREIRNLLDKDIDDIRFKVDNLKQELFGLSWD